jgi:hypothetical protein
MAVQGPSNSTIQDADKDNTAISILKYKKPVEQIDIYDHILEQLSSLEDNDIDEIMQELEENEPIEDSEELEYNVSEEDKISEQVMNLKIEENKTERIRLLAQILSGLNNL